MSNNEGLVQSNDQPGSAPLGVAGDSTAAMMRVHNVGARTGKGRRDKTGWGSLPTPILHDILSHSLDSIEVNDLLCRTWKDQAESQNLIACTQARIWLSAARFVSAQWRKAVDSHHFWERFAATVDPTRTILPPHSAHPSAALSSSTAAQVPAHRELAKAAFSATCLVCRINRTQTFDSRFCRADGVTWIKDLGFIGVCVGHEEMFCQGCLRESGGADGDIGLVEMDGDKDWDEEGEIRCMESVTCSDCRQLGVDYAIRQGLKQCAYGGPIRGIHGGFDAYAEEYVVFSTGNARSTAEDALEKVFMEDHMRLQWNQILVDKLQTIESHIRRNFFHIELYDRVADGTQPTDRVLGIRGVREQERDLILAKLDIMRKLHPWLDMTYHDMFLDTVKLKKQWWWEWTFNGAEAFIEQTTLLLKHRIFNRRYHHVLRSACIRDFVDQRILNGMWILPSVEINILATMPDRVTYLRQQLASRNTTPSTTYCLVPVLKSLSISTRFPFPDSPDLYRILAADGGRIIPYDIEEADFPGMINLFPLENGLDPFLPPPTLLKEMDEVFKTALSEALIGALKRLAGDVRNMVGGDDEAAEMICEAMGIGEVLEGLKGKAVWMEHIVVRRRHPENNGPSGARVREGGGRDDDMPLYLEDAAANRQEQGSVSAMKPTKVVSPRVELVVDEETTSVEPDFGIQVVKGDDSHLPRHEPTGTRFNTGRRSTTEEPSALGKRKSPPTLDTDEGSPPKSRQTPNPSPAGLNTTAADAQKPGRHAVGSRETTISSATDEIVMPITPVTPEDIAIIHATLSGDIKIASQSMKAGIEGQDPIFSARLASEGRVNSTTRVTPHLGPSSISSGSGSDEDDMEEEDISVEVGRGPGGHYEYPDDNDDEDDNDEYVGIDEADLEVEFGRANLPAGWERRGKGQAAMRPESGFAREKVSRPRSEDNGDGTILVDLEGEDGEDDGEEEYWDEDEDEDGEEMDEEETVAFSPVPHKGSDHRRPSSQNWEQQLLTPILRIPFVPTIPPTSVGGDILGVLAQEVIMRTWWDARAGLRSCRCGICVRARSRGELYRQNID